MSQNGHEKRSCTKGPSAADAARRPVATRSICPHQWRSSQRPQQPSIPLLVHIASPPSRALPDLAVRAVRPAHQRNGHRQYLRTGREVALLGRRMGEEHPLLPRPPSDRPGRVAPARVVGAVRPERVPVLDAPARGSVAGRCRSARLADGGGPRGGFHGSHTNIPRASGEAESAPRGLGGVLLSEGDRPLHDRCVRSVGRSAHRELTGEVTVRVRRILQESIPEPADEVRQVAPPATFAANRQLASNRTAVLRPTGGEDAHRDANKGHAPVGELVLVAVHGDHVTYDVETAGSGLIRALRPPAVPAQPALRPVPAVPA